MDDTSMYATISCLQNRALVASVLQDDIIGINSWVSSVGYEVELIEDPDIQLDDVSFSLSPWYNF